MDAQQTHSSDAYLKMVEWLHARRKPLLIGGAAVAVIGLVWAIISYRTAQNEADANTRFYAIPLETAMAVSPQPANELVGVAKEYPGTAAGEYADVLAAKDLFLQGKYPEAYKQFAGFIENYPDSALVPQAKVGLAACLEGEVKIPEAIQKYHEIVLTYPSEASIASPAKLTMARLLEESGQLQLAVTSYVELARLLAQNPNDIWAAEARERAILLTTKYPQLMSALTNAAATGAPSSTSMPEMGHATPAPGQRAPGAPPANAPTGGQGVNPPPSASAPANAAGKP